MAYPHCAKRQAANTSEDDEPSTTTANMSTPDIPTNLIQHLTGYLLAEDNAIGYHLTARSQRPSFPLLSFSPQSSSAWPVHQRQNSNTNHEVHVPSSTPLKPSNLYSIPLPAQVDPNVTVIPFLQSGSGSGLDIDLRMSSRQLGLRGEGATQLQRYLAVPATSPPLPSMTVVHPELPWPITVHFSGMDYVTVWDVLVTIVESLRLPTSVPLDSESDAGRRRRSRGGTRLDYLPGRRLVGLKKSEVGEDMWFMEYRFEAHGRLLCWSDLASIVILRIHAYIKVPAVSPMKDRLKTTMTYRLHDWFTRTGTTVNLEQSSTIRCLEDEHISLNN
ncbi:hypothetical protein D9758_017957 [Tetrapyrgos nigripes]|uniref:DUF6699 domain-containing protein n=1 Tax=Tetrapyrgos nigripes TaxID=182062 RepID=A0A8H5FG65_9AGAR|nr:hypothetical protein D9758_017957 [Tetrapyrgos nigripes]